MAANAVPLNAVKEDFIMAKQVDPWNGVSFSADLPTTFTDFLKTANFGNSANFALTMDEPDEAQIVDVVAGIQTPAQLTWRRNQIKNVYSAFGNIPIEYRLGSAAGQKLTSTFQWIRSISDPEIATYLKLFPIGASVNLYSPYLDILPESILQETIARAIAGFFQLKSNVVYSRIAPMLRGAVKPQ